MSESKFNFIVIMVKKQKAKQKGNIKYPAPIINTMDEEVKKKRYEHVISYLSNPSPENERKLLEVTCSNDESDREIEFHTDDPIQDQLAKHFFLTLFGDVADFSWAIIPSLITKLKSSQFMKNTFVPLLKKVLFDYLNIEIIKFLNNSR